ncbi:uncharacterized protein [Oryza sativa Japonica Group]|uniref:uncharacterized protein n=1 Tax=Oryza sativa subsp. japonica TaxID=39947 RepID=UPI000E1B5994|nr:vegetative cell wall protein gp1-like [Oryza sativa Japonica Group]
MKNMSIGDVKPIEVENKPSTSTQDELSTSAMPRKAQVEVEEEKAQDPPMLTRIHTALSKDHPIYEPKHVDEALGDPDWVNAMHEKLNNFARNKVFCKESGDMMSREFEMSMIGELSFFLELQIKQLKDGTFMSQTKYIKDLLKRFGLEDAKPIKTPMATNGHLDLDEEEGGGPEAPPVSSSPFLQPPRQQPPVAAIVAHSVAKSAPPRPSRSRPSGGTAPPPPPPPFHQFSTKKTAPVCPATRPRRHPTPPVVAAPNPHRPSPLSPSRAHKTPPHTPLARFPNFPEPIGPSPALPARARAPPLAAVLPAARHCRSRRRRATPPPPFASPCHATPWPLLLFPSPPPKHCRNARPSSAARRRPLAGRHRCSRHHRSAQPPPTASLCHVVPRHPLRSSIPPLEPSLHHTTRTATIAATSSRLSTPFPTTSRCVVAFLGTAVIVRSPSSPPSSRIIVRDRFPPSKVLPAAVREFPLAEGRRSAIRFASSRSAAASTHRQPPPAPPRRPARSQRLYL